MMHRNARRNKKQNCAVRTVYPGKPTVHKSVTDTTEDTCCKQKCTSESSEHRKWQTSKEKSTYTNVCI